MTRRYEPGESRVALAVARRMDTVERRVSEFTEQHERAAGDLAQDVAAIGRGLADVTAQLRRLDTPSPAGAGGGGLSGGGASGTGGTSGTGGEGDESAPQWDWFAVDDAENARALLEVVQQFTGQILAHYRIVLAPDCWALHPTVVADVLALFAERTHAYIAAKPTPVSEWLTRWLPAARERISSELAPCAQERGHRAAGRTWDLAGLDPASIAAWWATDRDRPAVDAFQLTAL